MQLRFCALVLLAFAANSLAAAESVAPAKATEIAGARQVDQHEAGMRVYVDPESGTLVAQPPAGSRSVLTTAADGSPMVELNGDAEQYSSQSHPNSVLTTAADGSPMVILNGDSEMQFGVQLDAAGKPVPICVEASHADQGIHVHAHTPTKSEVR